MQDSTKSRLITFSRRWYLSLIAFIGCSFAIVYVVAEGYEILITPCTVAMCLVFFIQFCQFVVAIVVRKWWQLLGALLGIAASLSVTVYVLKTLGAMTIQQ